MKPTYRQRRKKSSITYPRLSVFRSNRFIYTQLVDDTKKMTLVGVTEKELKMDKKLTKSQKARLIGELLAKKAKRLKITKVIFDRNGYKYHGRVKALAEGARSGDLQF